MRKVYSVLLKIKMDREIIEQLIKKQPLLDRELEKLENIREGGYCVHHTWGVGKILEYNQDINRLKISFEDGSERLMDPVFCAKKLEILAEDDILVQFKLNPEEVLDRVKNDPIAVLTELIQNSPKHELAISEIEFIFKRIVGEAGFRRWWTGVKRMLAKDSLIALSPKRSNTYILKEEPIAIEDEIIEQVQLNKDPVKKMEIATKILSLSTDKRDIIASEIQTIIADLNQAIQNNDRRLSLANKLTCCWIRNDLAESIGEDSEYLEPTPEAVIVESTNLVKLAEELQPAYYNRFLNLVTSAFPDEWEPRCALLLKNSKGRFTNECILFLVDRGCQEFLSENFNRWLNERSLKSPVLHWIVKNRHVRKFSDVISDGLIGHRLLKAIFAAIDADALNITGSKRIPLAEIVSEDRNLIHDLLVDASEMDVKDLYQMVIQNQWFDTLTKKALFARFIRECPSIQKLVSKDTGSASTADMSLYVSQDSLDAKRKEYDLLINEKIPANKKAIEIAREHGDLSENSEYKMARQDQEVLLSRKEQLEIDLKRAQVVDFNNATEDCVSIGSVVQLKSMSSDEVSEYAILGAWDSDPENNVLSYKTPLGQAVLSKKVGEVVQYSIGGTVSSWEIVSIGRYVDFV